MNVVGAIDVGSNAMRMLLGTFDESDRPLVLETTREAVRLGHDVFTTGSISEETIQRAVEAFGRFRAFAQQYKAVSIRAVGTSALREAANREELILRILQATGIKVKVITGEEEARLLYLAADNAVGLEGRSAMLIDIGGGSVEISLVRNGTMVATDSAKMGTVRLLELFNGSGDRSADSFGKLVRDYAAGLRKQVKKEVGLRKLDFCIGTGGNIEALGYLRVGLLGRSGDTELSLSDVEAILDKLGKMSYSERIEKLRLREDRADVIMPATIVLREIMREAKVERLLVPRVGLKDGILIDIWQQNELAGTQPERRQVFPFVIDLGEKYCIDERHATLVASLSEKLFDLLRPLHSLGADAELLLKVAAYLHEIGQFVGINGYHKHSAYLIRAAAIVGLSQKEKDIVAAIVRYHRKAAPKPEHSELSIVAREDQGMVLQLASILRIADAMAGEGASRVRDFEAYIEDQSVLLSLHGQEDLLVERWKVLQAGEMFGKAFGTRLEVEIK